VELEYPKIERIEGDERYAKFACEPLPPGYGTTLGNSLRRVLLSSIEGAAITAVKIDGVLHEFSPIPGVVEDATDIILNLKQIPFKMHSEQGRTLYLRVEKPGVVRAKDIEVDQGVEILEPHEIERAQRIFYRDGFVVVKNLLDPERLALWREASARVLKQILEIQVRQGRIGDELEPPEALGIAGGGHAQRIRGGPTGASSRALQGFFPLLRSTR